MPDSKIVLPAESERERALLATAEIWEEAGYAGLSADAISARAKIETDAFAAMFAEVEGAAQATLQAPIAAMVGTVSQQFSPDRSEPESCMMGIVAMLELMAANPAYAYVVYIGRRESPVPASVSGIAKTTGMFMVAMLERLRESSNHHSQPATAGIGALGAAEVVVCRAVVAGSANRLRELAPSVVYGATVAFVGQDEALRLAELSLKARPWEGSLRPSPAAPASPGR
jgi:AcrR family transcriptional regulator